MCMKANFIVHILTLILFITMGCGEKLNFRDYLPFNTGSEWIFKDEEGNLAKIEVNSDSLISLRDTVYSVFFLGQNIGFIKTPNSISWHFIKKVVIEDREVVVEDRFYPFFEMPFIEGKTSRVVYENRDAESGVYFKRVYDYVYNTVSEGISIGITTCALYVYNGDSIREEVSYDFLLVPDTGFKKITYGEGGVIHRLELIEYFGE